MVLLHHLRAAILAEGRAEREPKIANDRARALPIICVCTTKTSNAIAYAMATANSGREGPTGLVATGPDAPALGSSGVLRTQKAAGRAATEQLADDLMVMLGRRTSKQ